MYYLKAIFVGLFSWPLIVAAGASAQEPVDYEVIERIKAEAFGNSQVMDVAGTLRMFMGLASRTHPHTIGRSSGRRKNLKSLGLMPKLSRSVPSGLDGRTATPRCTCLAPST